MIELRKYEAAHVADLGVTEPERLAYFEQVQQSDFAYSAFNDSGRCIGVAGIIRMYGAVYGLWGRFSDDLRGHPFWFHRKASKRVNLWLANIDWLRVEVLVDADNAAACRWIKRLGFDFESRCWRGGPDGRDALRFVRVK